MKLPIIALSACIPVVTFASEDSVRLMLCGEPAVLSAGRLLVAEGSSIVGGVELPNSEFNTLLSEARVGESVIAHEADEALGEKHKMVDPDDCSTQYTDIAAMFAATAAGAGGGIAAGARVGGPTGAMVGGLAGAGCGLYASIQSVQNAISQCRKDERIDVIQQQLNQSQQENHCWRHGGSNCNR